MNLPISTSAITDELRKTLTELDKQIDAAKRDAYLEYRPIQEEPPADLVYRMKHRDGTYVLAPLLAAKANCLAAIANTQASQTQSRLGQMPRRGGQGRL